MNFLLAALASSFLILTVSSAFAGSGHDLRKCDKTDDYWVECIQDEIKDPSTREE